MASNCTLDEFRCFNWTSESEYCLRAPRFDCSMWNHCYCPTIKSDPDIAGKGILVAFMFSAAATIVLTVACLILKRDNDGEHFNKFDRWLRKHVCHRLREKLVRNNIDPDRWADRLYAVVLSLSDSQLITGIAMLASAIKLMNDGEILVYNFNIVSDLAWFSSNTHLLALLIIRTYMGSNKGMAKVSNRTNSQTSVQSAQNIQKQKSRFTNTDVLRYIRLSLMVILATLLAYVNYQNGVEVLYQNLACPMKCIAPMKKGGEPLKWTIVNFVFISRSYPTAILQSIPIAARSWLRLREKTEKRHKSILDNLNSPPKAKVLRKRAYQALSFIFIWAWNFLASELETVLEIIGWYVYGAISVTRNRNLGQTCRFDDKTPCMPQEEWDKQNQFGFGQLVPLFLLALPVFTFIEAWTPKNSVHGLAGTNNATP